MSRCSFWHLWNWVTAANWIGQKVSLQFIGFLEHYFTPAKQRAENGWILFVKSVALCCYNLLNQSVLEVYWILLMFVRFWFNLLIYLADIPRKMSFLIRIHETYWNVSLSWESQSELVNAEGDTASNLLQTLEHIRNIFSHNTEYLSSGNIFSRQILAKSAHIAREDTQVGSTLEQKKLWPKKF